MADEAVWLEFTIRMAPEMVERMRKCMALDGDDDPIEDVISQFACLGLLYHERKNRERTSE